MMLKKRRFPMSGNIGADPRPVRTALRKNMRKKIARLVQVIRTSARRGAAVAIQVLVNGLLKNQGQCVRGTSA
jgi:N-acetylglucosamine kinase-like BadF-type ATPase